MIAHSQRIVPQMCARSRARRRSSAVELYVTAVTSVALLVLLAVFWRGPAVDLEVVTMLACVWGIVQLVSVPIPHGSEVEVARLEEAIVVPMAMGATMANSLPALVIGIVVANVLMRQTPLKLMFNAAQMLISVAVAMGVTAFLVGPAPGLTVQGGLAASIGVGCMFVVNQLLVGGVISIASGSRLRRVVRDALLMRVVFSSGNMCLGLLIAVPSLQEPWLLVCAAVPMVVVHSAYRTHVETAAHERRLGYTASHHYDLAAGSSVEEAAAALVAGTLDLMNACEVVLFLAGIDGGFRATIDGAHHDPFVSESEHESGIGRELRVELPREAGASGTLVVRWNDPSLRAVPVGARDRMLLQMLVGQSALAIGNAVLLQHVDAVKRKFEGVFTGTSEGMLVIAEGGDIVAWNPSLERMTGRSAAEVIGRPLSYVLPELIQPLEASSSGVVDIERGGGGGLVHVLQASFDRLGPDSGGSPTAVIVRDVTAAREADRTKDDFLATVSHEFRTPLTVIAGFLDTMRAPEIILSPSQVDEFHGIMQEQTQRLDRLVSDLLDVTSLESGRKLTLELLPVDLRVEAREAARSVMAAHPESHIRILETGASTIAVADAGRLQQVLTNLLDNARKHAGTEVTVAFEADHSHARVLIRDTGKGISSTDLGNIFDRFYVTSDSPTRRGGGVGLGLYICRRLAEAMGGDVTVESEVGVGTTFIVSLPQHVDRARPRAPESQGAMGGLSLVVP